jgi:hypothetical protein
LLTVDKSIPHQQNLNDKQIILITLIVKHNKLEHLLPLVPAVNQAMPNATPGQIIYIGKP